MVKNFPAAELFPIETGVSNELGQGRAVPVEFDEHFCQGFRVAETQHGFTAVLRDKVRGERGFVTQYWSAVH